MSEEYVRPKAPKYFLSDVTEEEEIQGWREGQWKTFLQFKCIRCPFDSLERLVMSAHIYEDHVLKDRLMEEAILQQASGVRPIAADLFDAQGRKLDTIEDPELRDDAVLAELYGISEEE
jgi:hypothetical protein